MTAPPRCLFIHDSFVSKDWLFFLSGGGERGAGGREAGTREGDGKGGEPDSTINNEAAEPAGGGGGAAGAGVEAPPLHAPAPTRRPGSARRSPSTPAPPGPSHPGPASPASHHHHAGSNPGRGSKAPQALRHGAQAQKKYKPESLPTPTFETLKPVSNHSLHLICVINHSVF